MNPLDLANLLKFLRDFIDLALFFRLDLFLDLTLDFLLDLDLLLDFLRDLDLFLITFRDLYLLRENGLLVDLLRILALCTVISDRDLFPFCKEVLLHLTALGFRVLDVLRDLTIYFDEELNVCFF